MHAEIVDRLEHEGPFSPKQAMEIATAIDASLERAQYVTVPILDARLSMLQADIDKRFAAVDSRFVTVNARFDVLQADIDKRFGAVDSRFDVLQANMDKRFGEQKTFTFYATVVTLVAIWFANSSAGTAVLNVLKHLL